VPHLNALDSFLPGTAGGAAASPQAARAGPAAAVSPAAPASDARPSNPVVAAPADAVAAQQPAEAKAAATPSLQAAKPAAKVKPAAKSTSAASRPAKRSFLDCVAESQTEYVQMPTSVKKRFGEPCCSPSRATSRQPCFHYTTRRQNTTMVFWNMSAFKTAPQSMPENVVTRSGPEH